jgi:hypothetical protein
LEIVHVAWIFHHAGEAGFELSPNRRDRAPQWPEVLAGMIDQAAIGVEALQDRQVHVTEVLELATEAEQQRCCFGVMPQVLAQTSETACAVRYRNQL